MNYIHIVFINVQSLLDSARFHSLYNVIQSNNIDILLAQDIFLTDDMSSFYESNYSAISITSNCKKGSRDGVFTIINSRMTI